MVVAVSRQGVTRDFLLRSSIPHRIGYRLPRKTGVSRDSRDVVVAALSGRKFTSTRLIFKGSNNFGMIVAGPGGLAKISHQGVSLLLCFTAVPPGTLRDWEQISESVWPDPDLMPDIWKECLTVQVFRLRGVLKSIGSEIEIVSRYGLGFTTHRLDVAVNDNRAKRRVAA
ncbi:hypothetical protein [Thalassospira xiamenensis]|uniref:hypothetical protein n=1 Tax=Thalassospira xiamenensis TaxID=220697 RepID=UPI000DED9C19|nr:hypothetical protein [Thalassospira xiamenensis]RCK40469.1 hypothetical protein TH24_11060 [Thalassospira xiamenensis]